MSKLLGSANECGAIIGVHCKSLVDTGSMVTTLAQNFYNQHLSHVALHALDD